MSLKYILIGQTPVPCDDVETWAEWFESGDRVVQQDILPGYFVSTIFLGLDHNFSMNGPPILFETMAWHSTDELRFNGLILQNRCSTWLEAEEQHAKAVVQVMERMAFG